MPLYEFQCQQCNTVSEELVPMGSTGEGLICPKCGAKEMKKQFSAFNSPSNTLASSCQFAEQCADAGGGAQGGGCCGGHCMGHG